ncbi:MAG: hypothetical protein ABI282_05120 [Candidatus Baltobacteraceae bacterium]
MKPTKIVFAGALALAMALPVAAFAQQAPDQAVPAASMQPGAPMSGAESHEHHAGMMQLFKGVNLTTQQHAKIRQMMDTFHAAHPEGSPPDATARQALHEEIMGILTPAQQAQVKANMTQMQLGHPMAPEASPSAPPG